MGYYLCNTKSGCIHIGNNLTQLMFYHAAGKTHIREKIDTLAVCKQGDILPAVVEHRDDVRKNVGERLV